MYKVVSGKLQEKIRIPFEQENIHSVINKRQMFLMLSDQGIYSISKARPSLKKLFLFSEKCLHSILFSVKNKVFVLRITPDHMLKIYTTIKSLEFSFLFQIKLKKFSNLKFFSSEKILTLWSKKKLYILDLKKVLLKKKGCLLYTSPSPRD